MSEESKAPADNERAHELSRLKMNLSAAQDIPDIRVITGRAEIQEYLNKGIQASSVNPDDGSNSTGFDNSIAPFYDLGEQTALRETSSELGQVCEAMIANTGGLGYRIKQRNPNRIKATKDELEAEEILTENFFERVNSDQDITRFLKAGLWHFYLTGQMCIEITRGLNGKPDGLHIIPTYQMRMIPVERTPHRFELKVAKRTKDGYAIETQLEAKRFRRYVQDPWRFSGLGGSTSRSDTRRVWFKEFQDPREYDSRTGEQVTDPIKLAELKSKGLLAHEMLWIGMPVTRGVYSFPKHQGNMYSIFGDAAADKINFATFTNNNIPSMIISVSGGMLNAGSLRRLNTFIESKIQGRENRSMILLLESEIADEDLDTGRPAIHVEPTHDARNDDAMFTQYQENSRNAVRRSYRLPKMLVGRADVLSKAAISAAIELADVQIFAQERSDIEFWINARLLPELGIANHLFSLNTPDATDPAVIVGLVRDAEKSGAMTPRIGRRMISDVFSEDLGDEWPEDFNPDQPMTLTVLDRQKKTNESGANNPTGSQLKTPTQADPIEPAQTVMADPG